MSPTAEPVPLAELEARSSALPECAAWKALAAHRAGAMATPLRTLLDRPGRYERNTRAAGSIRLDYSRQRIGDDTMGLLLDLARERDLGDWIRHLFAGDRVNSTEARPALHVALRNRGSAPFPVDGKDVMPAVRGELERMLALAEAVRGGAWLGHSGRTITDVVNIGIGGSDLGLVMAVEALRPFASRSLRTHFVSNVDGAELTDALARLEPDRTLFVICSKSFTTLETQLNAEAARRWLLERLPEAAIARHFVAVSVNDPAMDRFGIAPANRFRIWDWVGGRYSLWSSVGLAIAMAIGARHFTGLLEGAYRMDEHFRTAPLDSNLPVLLGLLGVWNQNFLGTTSHAVLPYTQRLHRLPAFLQQLEMESNGKRVTRDGRPVGWTTGTVVWGEAGSNAQHAFFQLLHQGTAQFSADFIATARPVAGDPPDQHVAAIANLLAQAEAFARGRDADEAAAELRAAGRSAADVARLGPHKVHPGNHPSTIIVMRSLDPAGLGELIALYEHKVFTQGVIWGINSFDQWGVELGKVMAQGIGAALAAGQAGPPLPGVAADILGESR